MNLPLYQTPAVYEQALARHAQNVRWMKGVLCTCFSSTTQQADPKCSYCKGRGTRYLVPQRASIHEELQHCSYRGAVSTSLRYVPGSVVVRYESTRQSISIVDQSDGLSVLLASPYPKPYDRLLVSYESNLLVSVTADICDVIATLSATRLVVRPRSTLLQSQGMDYESTIAAVQQVAVVYDDATQGTLPVVKVERELITLDTTGVTKVITEIRATYSHALPFRFLVHSISEKVKWESGYVAENAQAMVIVPAYVKASVNDLFTILSAEQVANIVIDPVAGSNDVVRNYYDLSKILDAQSSVGTALDLSKVSIYNRNEIVWVTGYKPTTRYMLQVLYHPTFVALPTLPTLRNAEDKAFVNRINVVEYTRLSGKTTF